MRDGLEEAVQSQSRMEKRMRRTCLVRSLLICSTTRLILTTSKCFLSHISSRSIFRIMKAPFGTQKMIRKENKEEKLKERKFGRKYKRGLNLINQSYMFFQTHFICFSLLYKD